LVSTAGALEDVSTERLGAASGDGPHGLSVTARDAGTVPFEEGLAEPPDDIGHREFVA
jgi:hypothetical protein